MSLIADSLKKALKVKEAKRASRPEFNLISKKKDVFKSSKLAISLRSFILIILPGTLLAYLVYQAAFDKKRGFNLRNLFIWEILNPEKEGASAKASIQVSASKPDSPPTPEPRPVISEPSLKLASQEELVQNPSELEPMVVESATQVDKSMKPAPETEQSVIPKPVAEKPPQPEVFKKVPPIFTLPTESKKKPVTIKRKPRVAFKPLPREHAPFPPPETQVKTEKKHVVLLTRLPNIPTPKPVAETRITQAPGPNILKDNTFFYNQGVFFQESGDYEKALVSYHKASQLDPGNPEIHNNLGLVLKEMKRLEEALDEFMRAVFLEPNDAKAYNNMGVIYYMKGNLKGALSNYQKALEINPNNLETYNNMGIIYKNQRWIKKAESVYNKAFSLNPKHPGTNYNLGLFHEELNNIDSAIYFYRRFIEFGMSRHPFLVNQVKNHLRNLKRTS